MNIIKVSATSRTSAVAGAIAGVIREQNRAEVQAIGAGAVNQAVKAMILANGYLKEEGITISATPEFVDVAIDDKVRTAIKLVILPSPYKKDEVTEVFEELAEAENPEETGPLEETVVSDSFVAFEESLKKEETESETEGESAL